MRAGIAIVLAGVALAGAVYLGSLKLKAHGHLRCTGIATGFPGGCPAYDEHWVPVRAGWQIPVAIVIAAVGLGAAVVVARGD